MRFDPRSVHRRLAAPGLLLAGLLVVGLLAGTTFVHGQPTADGDQFVVPDFFANYQNDAAVATDAEGRFVVVWSAGGYYGGRFVVGQRYDADGSELGGQFQISTLATSYDNYQRPDVAVDADGDFVVVWESYASSGNDSSDTSIQAQRFASDGTALGGQFQVNTDTSAGQYYSAVGMADNGDFIVVWQSHAGTPDDTGDGIRGQRFSSDGTPVAAEFQVNVYTSGNQRRPDIAAAGDGSFVVVWHSFGSPGDDGSSNSIQGLRFDAGGSATGSQFQVNSYTTSSQSYPAIAMDGVGDFVVAWESVGSVGMDASGDSIQARRFSSDGTPAGSQFQVNTYYTSSQEFPDVSKASDGRFVVTWTSIGSAGDDGDNESIQGQVYDSGGSAVGSEFQVNTYTTDGQYLPAVAMDDDGEFVIVWEYASYNILGRRYVLATDVSITIDDGLTSTTAGSSISYDVEVENLGSEDTQATVEVVFPAALTCTWSGVPSGGATGVDSGSGDLLDEIVLPAGAMVTYTVPCDVDANASGTLSATATVTHSIGESNDTDNSATDDTDVELSADVSVTKDDSVTAATPGGGVTYTIVAANAGPSDTASLMVSDSFPAGLSCTWTSVAAGGASGNSAGVGDLADTISLPAGSMVTYTAVCNIDSALTGTLSNTATVTPSDPDPDPGNNSATDDDTVLVPSADVSISKSDAVMTAVPGQTVTYTIEVANSGPSDDPSVAVADVFPAVLGCEWTSLATGGASGNGSGSGDLVDTVSLPASSSVVYAATCAIDAAATGMLSNTATATASVSDPDPGNNEATDADTVLGVEADLSVTKTDNATSAVPGETLTYVVTVLNSGPSDASGIDLVDVFPSELENCSWTSIAVGVATGNSSSSGASLADTLDLAVGSSVSYLITCDVEADATGTLSNTATLTVPVGISDPDTGDQSASDSDTVLAASADLSITKDDGLTSVIPGQAVTYTITVTNPGPSAAIGTAIADTFPPDLTGCSWTCSSSDGGVCNAGGGPFAGDIATTVDLPPETSVTLEADCTVATSASGTLANTATVSAPAGVDDPEAGNDSATDTDVVLTEADLSITKDNGQTSAVPGDSVTYVLTVGNAGPLDVVDAVVADPFPSALTGCSWTCAAGGGASCAAGPVAGNVADTPDLPVGGIAVYTATCAIDPSASGSLVNTATVSPPAGITDPVAGNDSATDVDLLIREADLSITKTNNQTETVAGDSLIYVITAANAGPLDVVDAIVSDVLPEDLTCTWTCSGSGGATCTAGPVSGDIADTPDLPAGSVATYVAECDVSTDASGVLSNTATIAAPAGVSDPNGGNNSATDVDFLMPGVDLSITKDDGVDEVVPGTSTTYVVTATNAGPDDAIGATVTDLFFPTLSCTWTCAGAGGGSCTAAGSGDIVDTVDLPVGGEVTYTAECMVDPGAEGMITNFAEVSPPAGATEIDGEDNSDTDVNTLTPEADLVVFKDDGLDLALPSDTVTYTIEVHNDGPSDADAATVMDVFPPDLEDCSWTCVGADGATCTPGPLSGDLDESVDLPASSSVTFTAVCTVATPATEQIFNMAIVTAPDGVTDPDLANNSDFDLTDGLLALVFEDGFESGDLSQWVD